MWYQICAGVSTKKYFRLALTFLLPESKPVWINVIMSLYKGQCVKIQITTIKQCLPVVLFILLYKVVVFVVLFFWVLFLFFGFVLKF